MNEKAIRDKLVKHGQTLFDAPRKPIEFTKNPEADKWLNDLTNHPHAFVIGCIMDRQINTEKAWLIPYKISIELSDFSMQKLCSLSLAEVNGLMSKPEPLHHFTNRMSTFFYFAVQRICNQYSSDAANIWTGSPSSAEVVYRFLEFDGVGPKIANMAANSLARDFKIPFSDYFSIDISVDVHVRRVFARLGLCASNATENQVIYKARALHPKFPGMMDLYCWKIGKEWCKARDPKCASCDMRDLCPTAIGESERPTDGSSRQCAAAAKLRRKTEPHIL